MKPRCAEREAGTYRRIESADYLSNLTQLVQKSGERGERDERCGTCYRLCHTQLGWSVAQTPLGIYLVMIETAGADIVAGDSAS